MSVTTHRELSPRTPEVTSYVKTSIVSHFPEPNHVPFVPIFKPRLSGWEVLAVNLCTYS